MTKKNMTLAQSLKSYATIWPEGLIPFPLLDRDWEGETVKGIAGFVARYPNGENLERICLEGHITGSALVTNAALDRVLLTLHAKLGKWLQLGGHVDGNPDVAEAALREAREESGRDEVELYPWETYFGLPAPAPLDVDIHEIPARKDEPAHLHYDIRYLCVLDDKRPLRITRESKDLRWLTLEEARAVTTELSMLRQFEKLLAIKKQRALIAGGN